MKGEKYEIKNPFTVNVRSGNGPAAYHFKYPTESMQTIDMEKPARIKP